MVYKESIGRGLNMDKSQLQKRTKKLLRETGKPEKFIDQLQDLLKILRNKGVTKDHSRVISDLENTYNISKPMLSIIAKEIGRKGKKDPKAALELLRLMWQWNSFDGKTIAAKALKDLGEKAPAESLQLVKSKSCSLGSERDIKKRS